MLRPSQLWQEEKTLVKFFSINEANLIIHFSA